MKSTSKILIALFMSLSFISCNAQIKNAKIENVKIYGNCEMCEKTIEKAGNLKKVSSVDWNEDTKMATLTYDSKKTNQTEILKRIALAGYDNDSFLAPDDAYDKLPDCCQYERVTKTLAKTEVTKIIMVDTGDIVKSMTMKAETENQLISVFDNYFDLKDALVQSNGKMASEKSKLLLNAIKNVKMDSLSMDVHMVWMKILAGLKKDAELIANTKEISKQRDHFMSLSKNIFTLMKIAKYEQPIYYQFCPMANDGKGANWLSKENAIKNPYYGSEMMTCGKTIEILNNK